MKNSLLTGRTLQQSQTQGRAAVCCDRLEVKKSFTSVLVLFSEVGFPFEPCNRCLTGSNSEAQEKLRFRVLPHLLSLIITVASSEIHITFIIMVERFGEV